MSAVSVRVPKSYGRFRVIGNPLPLNAKPVECDTLLLHEVDSSRKIYCEYQTTCCTHAASKGWDGFHCRDCKIKNPMSYTEHRSDLDGLTLLLATISTPAH